MDGQPGGPMRGSWIFIRGRGSKPDSQNKGSAHGTNTCVHACMHTHTHARTHARTHTHTHTEARECSCTARRIDIHVHVSGMEYSYLYLYSYLLEYFFSVLSCTLYLAKFMSTCTRTYLSTFTKKPILMSTLRVLLSTFFFKF